MVQQAIMSGLNAVSGLLSSGKASARQYRYNLNLQHDQQNWNEKMYRSRYQMQTEDLKKAGINKLYGLGSAPAVTSGLNSVGLEDDQRSAIAMSQLNQHKREIDLTEKNQEREWSARQVEMENTKQKTETEKQLTDLTKYQKLTQQEQTIQKQIENKYLPEFKKNQLKEQQANIQNLKSATLKNIKESQKAQEETMNARRTRDKIKEEIENQKIINEIEGRKNQWEKNHPYLYEMGETGRQLKETNDTINDYISQFNPIKMKQRNNNIKNNTSTRKYK